MVRLDKPLVPPMVFVTRTDPLAPPFRFKLRAVLSLSTGPRRVTLAPAGNALLDVVSSETFAPSTMAVSPPEPLSSVIAWLAVTISLLRKIVVGDALRLTEALSVPVMVPLTVMVPLFPVDKILTGSLNETALTITAPD